MLDNKADAIENYILEMLSKQEGGQVELKRTELAGEVSCAPSQISYVLSTRFTDARGFKVESRRGLGGYIRITILADVHAERKAIYETIFSSIDERLTFKGVNIFLQLLLDKKHITPREAELVSQTAKTVYAMESEKIIQSEERINILTTMFKTLAKMSD